MPVLEPLVRAAAAAAAPAAASLLWGSFDPLSFFFGLEAPAPVLFGAFCDLGFFFSILSGRRCAVALLFRDNLDSRSSFNGMGSRFAARAAAAAAAAARAGIRRGVGSGASAVVGPAGAALEGSAAVAAFLCGIF